MNTQRIIVLGLALVAAVAAAFLVRSLIGGGASQVQARPAPPAIAMSEVLVASANLQPGQKLDPTQVHWQRWPSSAVDSSFISNTGTPIAGIVKGTVVRSPVLSGQPLTSNAIVHADAAGFMAAILGPGMRAVSIAISADSGAGGFILPNDHVDLLLTQKLQGSPPQVRVNTVLSNIRVLAVDQTFKEDKDTKTVLGKTATLELTPDQAEIVARASGMGSLQLSLRSLDESLAQNTPAPISGSGAKNGNLQDNGPVTVYRYGIGKPDAATDGGRAN
ncbi:MAG TPA: Flp pilus assembly protein CpaB [Rhizomicrobium sp.]|jgi:pilus assembly protein CpaB|nr:Flp pilus assembly protein CpaB [Rhizomicrobium sp.]